MTDTALDIIALVHRWTHTADSASKQQSDAESFTMGDAGGHFTYIEDPDGYLIEFVETHKIPIITHCDDQGFRTTSPREAWNATDPASWTPVLDAHPALRIDFAHVGRQYGLLNRGQGLLAGRQGSWTSTLIKLMREADDVWSDISFTGADASFYKDFLNHLSTMDGEAQAKVRSRLMMGTDFAINLLKVDSYPDYLSRVEDSLFDDDFIKALVSDNPLAFLS